MRVAYLGPAGTYTHAALLGSAEAFVGGAGGGEVQALARATVHDVVIAVRDGDAARGVVPIENSVEGSVNATLDALAFGAPGVRIVGETVLAIHHCLIGHADLQLSGVTQVISHAQALAQCAGFLRARLPDAQVTAATSTAEAVRAVVAGDWGATAAALGPRSAAERYGGRVLAADVEDVAGNATRFAWLARADVGATGAPGGAGHLTQDMLALDAPRSSDPPARRAYKTAIAFWPREADHAGWLVRCLAEFSSRGINLTRIESRPRKVGLGEYVFFVDLDGGAHEPAVAAGLAAVEAHVAQLLVLGSFPAA